MTEFGTVTRPHPRGRATAFPKLLDPYLLQNGLTYSDEIGMVTVGNSLFLGGQPRPHPKRLGPQHPPIFWGPYMCQNGLTYSD